MLSDQFFFKILKACGKLFYVNLVFFFLSLIFFGRWLMGLSEISEARKAEKQLHTPFPSSE